MNGDSIENNNTPLHCAVQSDRGSHAGLIELLLRRGAPTEVMDNDKNTPLHLAVRGGHAGLMESMNRVNRTPLQEAAHEGHTGTAKLLHRKDA